MELKQLLNIWKNIFSNRKYMALTIFIALFFYSINAMIGNLKTILSFYPSFGLFGTVKLFFTLLAGFGNTIKPLSYISIIIISLLFGLLFSLIIYKTKMIKTTFGKTGIFASLGLFIGALAPGCAACGIGLFSFFGLSSAFLIFLPFQGLELSILSIGILAFSIMKISSGMYKCDVIIPKEKKKPVSDKHLYIKIS